MAATGLTSTLLEQQNRDASEANPLISASNRVLPWVKLVPGIQAAGTAGPLQKQNVPLELDSMKDLELDVLLVGQSRPPPSGIVFGTGLDCLDPSNHPLEVDIDTALLETQPFQKNPTPGTIHTAYEEIFGQVSEDIVHLKYDGLRDVLGLDVRGLPHAAEVKRDGDKATSTGCVDSDSMSRHRVYTGVEGQRLD